MAKYEFSLHFFNRHNFERAKNRAYKRKSNLCSEIAIAAIFESIKIPMSNSLATLIL